MPWEDLGLAALSLACVGYMFVNYDYVVNRFPTANSLSTTDMVVGVTGMLLVLEATRRTIGASLPIVAIVFLAYALGRTLDVGLAVPPRPHRSRSRSTRAGSPPRASSGCRMTVAATYVILFIIFGTFLEKSGAPASSS